MEREITHLNCWEHGITSLFSGLYRCWFLKLNVFGSHKKQDKLLKFGRPEYLRVAATKNPNVNVYVMLVPSTY